jgi:hypothetical protein
MTTSIMVINNKPEKKMPVLDENQRLSKVSGKNYDIRNKRAS